MRETGKPSVARSTIASSSVARRHDAVRSSAHRAGCHTLHRARVDDDEVREHRRRARRASCRDVHRALHVEVRDEHARPIVREDDVTRVLVHVYGCRRRQAVEIESHESPDLTRSAVRCVRILLLPGLGRECEGDEDGLLRHVDGKVMRRLARVGIEVDRDRHDGVAVSIDHADRVRAVVRHVGRTLWRRRDRRAGRERAGLDGLGRRLLAARASSERRQHTEHDENAVQAKGEASVAPLRSAAPSMRRAPHRLGLDLYHRARARERSFPRSAADRVRAWRSQHGLPACDLRSARVP